MIKLLENVKLQLFLLLGKLNATSIFENVDRGDE